MPTAVDSGKYSHYNTMSDDELNALSAPEILDLACAWGWGMDLPDPLDATIGRLVRDDDSPFSAVQFDTSQQRSLDDSCEAPFVVFASSKE